MEIVLMKKFPSGVFKKSIANALNREEGNAASLKNYKPLSIERNDILIFFDPNQENRHLIKRCIGIPGDTILIDSANVYINRNRREPAANVVQKFFVPSSIFEKDSALVKPYLNNFYERNDTAFYTIQRRFINKVTDINKTFISNKYLVKRGRWVESGHSLYSGFDWSIDYFGPLIIPKKGIMIPLDSLNIEKYGYILSDYENNEKEFNSEVFKTRPGANYTCKNDYYFFLGDNRHNSIDSRYIGVIPMDKIIGKVNRVLFSVDDGEVEWGRTLLSIK